MAEPTPTPAEQPERLNVKEFSLKPIEGQLLQAEFQRHQVMLSSILNYFAIERLAYPVDKNTAFEMADNLTKLIIWQNAEPAEDGNQGPTPDAEPSATAQALKGGK